MSSVVLTGEGLRPAQLRQDFVVPSDCGGFSSFEGIIRNHNHGLSVLRLSYESYEPLARKELTRISKEAGERFDLKNSAIYHRIGDLEIGDVAVWIGAAAHHRDAAFSGCRYMIDELKIRVPIWKQEFYEDGSHAWTRCTHH